MRNALIFSHLPAYGYVGQVICVKRKLRRAAALLLAAVMTVPLYGAAGESAPPTVSAKCAALLNADTGELLYGKNEHERASMASTTKIMTSLLALERGRPDEVVTASEQAVRVEGTSIGLRAGDQITLKTLVCGMLLESGNDAANVTAEYLAGSSEAFAVMMNQRAAEIGMADTHFVTPSGLDDEEHYSTAYDMALLGACAIQNRTFVQICSAQSLRVSYGTPEAARTFTNHNRMLTAYEGAIGIKTGFTKKSGRCLVSAARRNGVTLVAVTLNDPDDWKDHAALLDYGFEQVQTIPADCDFSSIAVPVVGGAESSAAVHSPEELFLPAGQEVQRFVFIEKFLYAPVQKDDIIGEAIYVQNGSIVGRVALCAAADIPVRAQGP